jgi:hypothetical protein
LAKKAFVYDGTNWIDIAQSTADLSGYPALATNQFGFRNKIINGDFRINQRAYTSASNLASGSYGFDRWKSNFTNTTLTFTSAPQGQSLTINSGGGIEQVIERENMPAGTYILTWTGTATGRVYNTGATPPSYAASPVTVTLDGTANVEVEFTASGGTATLQNVQLEAGSVASAFERRPIGTELALCQRYYWRMSGSQGNYNGVLNGAATGGTAPVGRRLMTKTPVEMRVPPVLNFSGSNIQYGNGNGTYYAVASLNFNSSSTSFISIDINGGTGLTAGQNCHAIINSVSASDWFDASAEL